MNFCAMSGALMSNNIYPTRYRAMAADTPIYECAQCQ